MSLALNYFRPMLAASLPTGSDSDLEKLDYKSGILASPKIDGIRGIKHPTMGLVSRTLKPIPNKHIQATLSSSLLDMLDGELVVNDLNNLADYNTNQSAIMSRDGQPKFTYCVFDDTTFITDGFYNRNSRAEMRVAALDPSIPVIHVEQKLMKSIDDIMEYEEEVLARGFEGLILRHRLRGYKNNRSTFREQGMIKLKRFEDAEAVIIGFEELYRNHNEPIIDKLGYQKRSSHQENQIPANTLGKLLVKGINGPWADVEFEIGSGFDMSLRNKIWQNRDAYLVKIVKYKFQMHGSKNKPRSPIFLGFRSKIDL